MKTFLRRTGAVIAATTGALALLTGVSDAAGADAAFRPPPGAIPPPKCDPVNQVQTPLQWEFHSEYKHVVPSGIPAPYHYFRTYFVSWAPAEWDDVSTKVVCDVYSF
ncbi:hypothetical protein ABZ342_34210 [Amycolatopsis sp. NPDC005961]|uniref:hypothetical protein n=1 Tax=Amycolatopsis TaxID=1813 RepID=UPI0012D84A80|nr:hypothetical protein [Amycolatopsis camponoti]